ncbi:MAG: NfeD family protein [Eubacteriales bacterium]
MIEFSAPIYWLIIFLVFLVFEIVTMGLTTIWFAAGALVAAVVAALGASLPVQIGVFIVISVVLLCLTRPLAMKYLNQKVEKTNTERLIGMDIIVIEEIDALHATGKVMVNGIEWLAMASDREQCYHVDDVVTIEGIQGVKVVVTKKEVN